MSHKGPMATIAKACGEPIYEPDGLIRPAEKKSTSVRGHEPAVELGDHLSAARSSEHHFGHVALHGHGGRTSIQGQHFQKDRTLTCINASCARSNEQRRHQRPRRHSEESPENLHLCIYKCPLCSRVPEYP